MYLTAGEIEYQPTVDRPEAKLAAFGFVACSLNIVKYPFQLCRRKICIDKQSRALPYILTQLTALYVITVFGGAAALPYDSIVYRFTGDAVPHYRCFALIGYSYAVKVGSFGSRFFHSLARNGKLRVPYILGIVFDPSVPREYLRELILGGRDYSAGKIKNY